MKNIESNHKKASYDTISLTTVRLYEVPLPPDGGYGWIVVLAAFCIHMVADGLTFSFGIIYYELIHNYDESYFKTSLFICLFNGIPLLFAPITSSLIEKYSCRTIAVIGGFLTHLGFFLSFFTKSFSALFVTLSLIAPVGLSFMYIPSIVMVSRYFDKKRALATGIAVSGSGIGGIVFSPLIYYLCDTYTLKGALLILSGIILHVCFFGLLYKPFYNDQMDKNKAELFLNACDTFVGKVEVLYKQSDSQTTECNVIESIECPESKQAKSVIHQPSDNLKGPVENHINYEMVPSKSKSHSSFDLSVTIEDESTTQKPNNSYCFTESVSSRNFVKQSIFLSGIKTFLLLDHRAIFGKRPVGQDMKITFESVIDPLTKPENPRHKIVARSKFQAKYILNLLKTKGNENIIKTIMFILKGIFDLKFLKKWSFCGMIFSNFLLYFCFPVAYNNLPDYSDENNIGNTSHYPLLLGVGNCFGQISLGFLGDLPCVQSIALYSFVISIAGICCLILPFYKYFRISYIIFSLVFGFSISANFSLCSVVLVDIFGLENLTSTYGMVLFGQGLGSLFGPGISGYLRDYTGDYDTGFFSSGSGIIFSGLILVPLMLTENKYLNIYFKFKTPKYISN